MGCNQSLPRLSVHQKVIICDANDRDGLAAALERTPCDLSNSTSSTACSSTISVVRSDRLNFSGTGIRRHSRRKRRQHCGQEYSRIVVLRQPVVRRPVAPTDYQQKQQQLRKGLDNTNTTIASAESHPPAQRPPLVPRESSKMARQISEIMRFEEFSDNLLQMDLPSIAMSCQE